MAVSLKQSIDRIKDSLVEYIEASYHISDPSLIEHRKNLLEEPGCIFQNPYLESTPQYTAGDGIETLDVGEGASEIFAEALSESGNSDPLIFDPPYTHQYQAINKIVSEKRSIVVTTGTGSGKTETFLMPILAKLANESKSSPESFSDPAMRCMIMYPMNALVNDQLGRLRKLFGDERIVNKFVHWSGRPVRFSRYTSRTPYPGVFDSGKAAKHLKSIEDFYVKYQEKADDGDQSAKQFIEQLKSEGKWPAKYDIRDWYGSAGSRWNRRVEMHQKDAELITRQEIQKNPSDLLITNYAMLEYMLIRPIERPIFDKTRKWLEENPDESFVLVLDEAHLYTGAAGTEVALLVRKFTKRLGISSDRLQVICTSASFNDSDNVRKFASQLTGKPEQDFDLISGTYKVQNPSSPANENDVSALLSINLDSLYRYISSDEGVNRNISEWDPGLISFLQYRGVTEESSLRGALYQALDDFAPLGKAINSTMGEAVEISELAEIIFPACQPEKAEEALTILLSLGTIAKDSVTGANLFPCRVHSFFRGLPGLWVCMNPTCSGLSGPVKNSIAGRLYSQPRERCDDCKSRVLEFFTCRNCGSAYARGYSPVPNNPEYLWSEPGAKIRTNEGLVVEMPAVDLLLESPPSGTDNLNPVDFDFMTGRIGSEGTHKRHLFLNNPVNPDTLPQEDIGKFIPCGMCGDSNSRGYRSQGSSSQSSGPEQNQSTIMDHVTKGDQPFQALVNQQINIQPSQSVVDQEFSPLLGRKVLTFSDSRQTAARLAPNLQEYSLRDILRSLLLRGFSELQSHHGDHQRRINLGLIYQAVLYGADMYKARLRPLINSGETFSGMSEMRNLADEIGTADFLFDIHELNNPPEALLSSIWNIVTDKYRGLQALALASLKESDPRLVTELSELRSSVTNIDTVEKKEALLRAWIHAWGVTVRGAGIWDSNNMPPAWMNNRVRTHGSGRFGKFGAFLAEIGISNEFNNQWLPVLLEKLARSENPRRYTLMSNRLTLEIGGEWFYCDSCRGVSRGVPGLERYCCLCGNKTARDLDPDNDPVFSARKGYYRKEPADLVSGKIKSPSVAIITGEHTAQLNDTHGQATMFSKAEMNELLFQDIDIREAIGDPNRYAIDVLSSTTTMEVGIDIGALSGVALRNMPPARSNYQQRAGRAGRRADAIATVIAYGSADTHDEHYFSNPKEMIKGKIGDPLLVIDNSDIARRHVLSYLLQRYHTEKLPLFDEDDQKPELFDVLGSVADFMDTSKPLNKESLFSWLDANYDQLTIELRSWVPTEISDYESLIKNFAESAKNDIQKALGIELSPGSTSYDADDASEIQHETDVSVSSGNNDMLLDRLLHHGLLPKYAFPTDVANFFVIDQQTTEYRTELSYSPSQGLNVALSQYAPGREVWIDNRQYKSGAIYSISGTPALDDAWESRKTYYECECGFAKILNNDLKGLDRDCDACGSAGGLTAGKDWITPPGFLHRAQDDPRYVEYDEAALRTYPTRAKLDHQNIGNDNAGWQKLNDFVQAVSGRSFLIITNRGHEEQGYRYCRKCGLIEHEDGVYQDVVPDHLVPYLPTNKTCEYSRSSIENAVVLGTEFITDILLYRFNFNDEDSVILPPRLVSTESALRTVCESLISAGSRKLSIDPSELQAEYRHSILDSTNPGKSIDLYLYDTLSGGAGFAQKINHMKLDIFSAALDILENCPDDCDKSCYKCIRNYGNKFDHALLDRKLGSDLIKYLLGISVPNSGIDRLQQATETLFNDLDRLKGDDFTIERSKEISVPEIGSIIAPIYLKKNEDGDEWVVAIHNSLTPDYYTPELNDFKEFQSDVLFVGIDEIEVVQNLPQATSKVMEAMDLPND